MQTIRTCCSVLLLLLAVSAAAQPPRTLSVGGAQVAPGALTWVSVFAHGEDVLVAQADLLIPAEAQVTDAEGRPVCAVNPAIAREWSFFGWAPGRAEMPDGEPCTPGESCTGIRALILDRTEQVFVPIPSGSVLFRCLVRTPEAGVLPVGCVEARAVGTAAVEPGSTIGGRVDCAPAVLEVVAGCPAGDIDSDGTVSVSEVVATVNAALGACP